MDLQRADQTKEKMGVPVSSLWHRLLAARARF